MATSDTHWLTQAYSLSNAGEPFIVATIIVTQGSSPQPVGGKMLITATAIYGTIGGGKLEWETIAAARQLLADENEQALHIWNLSASMGQCCGGKVAVLLERQTANAPTIAIFGLGHVGSETATMFARLPYRVIGVDNRPDHLTACNATITRLEGDIEHIQGLPANAYVLIMTHAHPLDLSLCEAALRRGDFAYVGVIGSKTKSQRFCDNLKRRGINPESLVCPIGGTSGTHPTEIAAAIVGDIVARIAANQTTPTTDNKRNMQLLKSLSSHD